MTPGFDPINAALNAAAELRAYEAIADDVARFVMRELVTKPLVRHIVRQFRSERQRRWRGSAMRRRRLMKMDGLRGIKGAAP